MTTPLTPQDDFNEITQLIHAARQRAVNTALMMKGFRLELFFVHKVMAYVSGVNLPFLK